MDDRITANLPSRNVAVTVDFHGALGFDVEFQNDDWLNLQRGPRELEFFPHPTVDPRSSCFSACVRVDDLVGWRAAWKTVGLPSNSTATPRLTDIFQLPDAPQMFALVDPDGSLPRVLDNGG